MIPEVTATHVKFVVLSNQCTGNPKLSGCPARRPDRERRLPLLRNRHQRGRAAALQLPAPQVDGASLVD
jgi:hypothetical protein